MVQGSAGHRTGGLGGSALAVLAALLVAFALAFPVVPAQRAWADSQEITVGDPDNSGKHEEIPFSTIYNNAASCSVYKSSELASGAISAISYYHQSNPLKMTDVSEGGLSIWMGYVDGDEPPATIDADAFVQVCSSTTTPTGTVYTLGGDAGKVTIPLTESFDYDASKGNLLVFIAVNGKYGDMTRYVNWLADESGTSKCFHDDNAKVSLTDLSAAYGKVTKSVVKRPVASFTVEPGGNASGDPEPGADPEPAGNDFESFAADLADENRGTAEAPYRISTGDELAAFAANVNGGETYDGKFFQLMKDIELEGEWTPVGTDSYAFAGTFDGAGHTVSGLSIDKTGYNSKYTNQGLFGVIGGATLKNFVVHGSVSVEGGGEGSSSRSKGVAGVVGMANSGAVIENVGNEASVHAGTSGSYAADGVAGVVGYAAGTLTVSGCYNKGKVDGAFYTGGGIVGMTTNNQAVAITSCYNAGDIDNTKNTSSNNYIYLGGIVGGGNSAAVVKNCLSVGAVKGKTGGYSVYGGFIAGRASTSSSGNYWVANGTVSSYDGYAGGYYGSEYDCGSAVTAEQVAAVGFAATLNGGGEGVWKSGEALGQGSPIFAWEDPGAPAITAQPQSAAYQKGAEAAALTVEAETPAGNEGVVGREAASFKFQWFRATDSGLSDAVAIDGATEASYVPRTNDTGTTYYYCVVTNGEGTASQSEAAAVGVYNDKAQAPTDAVIVAGEGLAAAGDVWKANEGGSYTLAFASATNSNAAEEKGFAFQWQASEDGVMWADIEGATGETYTATDAAIGTVRYRCLVDAWSEVETNVSGSPVASNAITVDVSAYEIADDAGWGAFAEAVNGGQDFAGKTVLLTGDVTAVTPAGTQANPFKGKFDGQGHTLTADVKESASKYAGVFGYVSGSAEFGNVTVAGSVTGTASGSYSGFAAAGGLIGVFSGANLKIDQVASTATITRGGSSYTAAGGIVGNVADGAVSIANSASKGSVEGGAYAAGGLVGQCATDDGLAVSDSYNVGAVTAYSSGYAGGIVGYHNYSPVSYNASAMVLTRCYNAGAVGGPSGAAAISGSFYSSPKSTIADCVFLEGSAAKAYGGYNAPNGTATAVSAGDLKFLTGAAAGLGGAFAGANPPLANNGFPRLAWEPEGPAVRTLSVMVRGADGADITNVSDITVTVEPDAGVLRKDSHGVYTIDQVSGYTVTAKSKGYEAASESVAAGSDDAAVTLKLTATAVPAASATLAIEKVAATEFEVGAEYVIVGQQGGVDYAMGNEAYEDTSNYNFGMKGVQTALASGDEAQTATFASADAAVASIWMVVADGNDLRLRSGDSTYLLFSSNNLYVSGERAKAALSVDSSGNIKYGYSNNLQVKGSGDAVWFDGRSGSAARAYKVTGFGEAARFAIAAPEATGGKYAVTVDGEAASEAAQGKTVTVTAAPDAGFVLDAITANGGEVAVAVDGNVGTFTMPGKDVTVAVTFKATHKVAFDADGGSAAPEAQTVVDGGKAEKPADPTKDDFVFAGWFADGSDEVFDFDAAVTGDVTLKARWTPVVYRIATADDLDAFAVLVNGGFDYDGKTVALAGDVVASEGFAGIGVGDDSTKNFAGTFDGAGHKVTLGIDYAEGRGDVGLFGRLTPAEGKTVTIKNLVVDGAVSASSQYVLSMGAVIGEVDGKGSVVLENVGSEAAVSYVGAGSGSIYVGGLVGNEGDGSLNVTGCFNRGAVTGASASAVGGLVAHVYQGKTTVDRSYNTGAIASTSTSSPKLGGLVGSEGTQVTGLVISNSFAATAFAAAEEGGADAGQLMGGAAYNKASFANCFFDNTLAVTAAVGNGNGPDTGFTGVATADLQALPTGLAALKSGSGNGEAAMFKASYGEYPVLHWENAKEAPAPEPADMTQLSKSITSAKAAKKGLVTSKNNKGTDVTWDKKWAPKAATDKLDKAVSAAQAVAADAAQEDVDAAKTALDQATAAFKKAIKAGTKAVAMSAVKVTLKDMTYTGKAVKPVVASISHGGKTIKAKGNFSVAYKNNVNVGTATATITAAKGSKLLSGKKTVKFKINPKGTSVTKVTAGKQQVSVEWKKLGAQVDGYELTYADNAKFAKAKTLVVKKGTTAKATISKLAAGKKYSVKVRTFKTSGKTKYYSAWSKAVTAKNKTTSAAKAKPKAKAAGSGLVAGSAGL